MRVAGGCAKFPVLARWSPPPPWPPSATELRFVGDVTSRPGLAWCHGSTPPGASGSCSASASASNIYLRRMLIHGARAVLLRVKYDTGGFGQWVHQLAQRAPRNKVVVAIANKLARIAWAVLSKQMDYRATTAVAAA